MTQRYDPLSISTQVSRKVDRRNAGIERDIRPSPPPPRKNDAHRDSMPPHAEQSEHEALANAFLSNLFGANTAPADSAPNDLRDKSIQLKGKQLAGTCAGLKPLNKYRSSLPAIKEVDGKFQFTLENTAVGTIGVIAQKLPYGLAISLKVAQAMDEKSQKIFERTLSAQLSTALGQTVKVNLND